MADHSKPLTTSTYTNFVTELDGRFDDLTLGLDPATTSPTNLATNAIRWSSASSTWQKYNGTTWNNLSSSYSININGTVGATTPSSGAFTTLSATGNVTLGDASADTVTINGTIQLGVVLSGSSSTDAFRITQTGTGNAFVVEDSANPDSTPFVIDATGKVGIGTSSPSRPLTVNTAGNYNLFYSASGAGDTGLSFASNGRVQGTSDFAIIQQSGGDALLYNRVSSNMIFATNNTERMRIDSSGNVGIGTTSPASQLTVTGTGQTTSAFNTTTSLGGSLMLGDTGSAAGNGGAIVFSASSTSWRFAAIKGFVTSGTNNSVGDITFSTRFVGTDSTLTEAMRIKNDGKVGIGTSSPAVKLAVSSTDAILLPVGTTAQRPTGATGYIRFNSTTTSFEGYNGSAWGNIGGDDGPAFSAYASASQTVTTATITKVAINTETFDTNSNFDTTNNRFTPTVEGYYQVNGSVRGTATTTFTSIACYIYKNGSAYKRSQLTLSFTTSNSQIMVSDVIYMNGSTDYIELFGSVNGTGTLTFTYSGSADATSFFSAVLVRGA